MPLLFGRYAAAPLVLLIAGAFLATPSLAESPPAPTAELDAFHGAWERVAIEEDEESRLSAIETAVAGLSWLSRKMAAPILRSTTSPPARYEFAVSAPVLLFSERGEELRPLPLDGSERRGEGPRGEFSAQSRVVDGSIATDWIVADARGSNRYTITNDGGTLLVEHRIEVTALDGVEEFAYQARFQRTPAVAAAGAVDPAALADSLR